MSRPRTGSRPAPQYPNREKLCPACNRTKPWREFYVLTRWPDGVTVKAVRSKCKLCESQVAQVRWSEKVAQPDREDELAARREHHRDRRACDPEYVEAIRTYARETRRWRYHNDPEFRADNIAKSIAFSKSPRGRKLEKKRRDRMRRAIANETSLRLRSEPWQTWLKSIEHRFDSQNDMATWLGTDESGLRRWLDGTTGVRLDYVDALLCGIGEPGLLMELWPELYGGDAA